jgi:hypothetical protein
MIQKIKSHSILLLIITIISCNESKTDNSHNFLSNCGDKIDSTKSLKLKIGAIDNLDILNGIKCFEFNNSIDGYKKLGTYTKHKDYEEILFDDDYCFNYRNICWRNTKLIFFNGRLSVIELYSDLSVKEVYNLNNDFTALLGNPQHNLESKKNNPKDTIYLSEINTNDFNLFSENESIGIKNKSEILLGSEIKNNNSIDDIRLNVIKGTEYLSMIISKNKIYDIYITQAAKEIFNIMKGIDSNHNNKIEEFKKSF